MSVAARFFSRLVASDRKMKTSKSKIVPFITLFVHAPPQDVIKAWDDGVGRLIRAGVNGTILLANLGAVKGLAVSATTTPPWHHVHARVANRTHV